jgi:hypothetical protein
VFGVCQTTEACGEVLRLWADRKVGAKFGDGSLDGGEFTLRRRLGARRAEALELVVGAAARLDDRPVLYDGGERLRALFRVGRNEIADGVVDPLRERAVALDLFALEEAGRPGELDAVFASDQGSLQPPAVRR